MLILEISRRLDSNISRDNISRDSRNIKYVYFENITSIGLIIRLTNKMTAPTQNEYAKTDIDNQNSDDDIFVDAKVANNAQIFQRNSNTNTNKEYETKDLPANESRYCVSRSLATDLVHRRYKSSQYIYYSDGGLDIQDYCCRSYANKGQVHCTTDYRKSTDETLQMFELKNVSAVANIVDDDDDHYGSHEDGWRSYHYDEVGMNVDIRSNLSPLSMLSFQYHVLPFDDTINHKVNQKLLCIIELLFRYIIFHVVLINFRLSFWAIRALEKHRFLLNIIPVNFVWVHLQQLLG